MWKEGIPLVTTKKKPKPYRTCFTKKNKPDMQDFRLLSHPLHQEIFNFDHKWIITLFVRV